MKNKDIINIPIESKPIDELMQLIIDNKEKEAIYMINSYHKKVNNALDDGVLEMKTNNDGITALMAALFYERNELVRYLVNISNLSALDNKNMSPLSYACLTGNIDNIKFIYNNIKNSTEQRLFFIKNVNGFCPIDYLLTHLEDRAACCS